MTSQVLPDLPVMSISPEGTRSTPVRIAIVGAGIGGLSLASFLSYKLQEQSRNDAVKIDIYESSSTLTEIGAGVGMYLRTWQIMQSYGDDLVSSIQRIAPSTKNFSEDEITTFIFRKGDANTEGVSFFTLKSSFGLLTLHRASLQKALASNMSATIPIHFGKRLVDVQVIGPLSSNELHFVDGSHADADVVIGADGIRSTVRSSMFRQLQLESTIDWSTSHNVEPLWSGTVVYRSLIRCDELNVRYPDGHRATREPVVYFGQHKHIIAFPIVSPGSTSEVPDTVNLVAFSSKLELEGRKFEGPWMKPVDQALLLREFANWEPEVLALLDLARAPTLWAIHYVPNLSSYCSRQVCLLGDAAHAMTPHQGSGGGQAIEDAHVLAHLLSHPNLTKRNLPLALKAYDAIRRPIAQEVTRRSRLNGMMYELNEAYNNSTNGLLDEKLANLGQAIYDLKSWLWSSSHHHILEGGAEQVKKALQVFEDTLVTSAQSNC